MSMTPPRLRMRRKSTASADKLDLMVRTVGDPDPEEETPRTVLPLSPDITPIASSAVARSTSLLSTGSGTLGVTLTHTHSRSGESGGDESGEARDTRFPKPGPATAGAGDDGGERYASGGGGVSEVTVFDSMLKWIAESDEDDNEGVKETEIRARHGVGLDTPRVQRESEGEGTQTWPGYLPEPAEVPAGAALRGALLCAIGVCFVGCVLKLHYLLHDYGLL